MASSTVETEWISLRPSKTSLVLTLVLPVVAALVLFLLELSEVVRLGLLCVLLVVTVVDVYRVLQKHHGAVTSFRVRRVIAEPTPVDGASGIGPEAEKQPRAALQVSLRQRPSSGQLSATEITAEVLAQTYVSVYFTSIAYRRASDPAWRRYFPRILAIWPDAVDAELYRQVRVLLRHGI